MRADVRFPSGDGECAGWLYTPAGGHGAVAVVLGVGVASTMAMCLGRYARPFAEAGYTALAFDHRSFGASPGEPRQRFEVGRQLEDWAAAIAYARGLEGVERVALFGTSFGGGNALAAAARDPAVAGVLAQCPFTDGLASSLTLGPRSTLRLTVRAVRDLLGRRPVLVAAAGPKGSAALMTSDDAVSGYAALPADDFVNAVTARIALRIPTYRPGRAARRLAMPVWFGVCEADTVAPPGATLRHAARVSRATIARYPVGHFDVYHGAAYDQALADQLAFLREQVPLVAR